ncbi:nitroreductase family deazaflavin-dependent oxidoreductase [[Mycobacterium] kokjensenii]|uniref:Nitroreductase family deazaflavin-dependent oxidoreductase n=1 Tax=[Mycobacterium] kokjensenii TaxID=3064287 RepID=A0ABM9LX05_9MYCO|nr:nitroreductase family deazaflavin-dependent oxidoreductase [Mycolicibacter sp. MU0083]CAJ1506128.1 nitroreductase family deazaflavin-dependent oxidoreductase [Mycolicibacter sp. MU0083]
MSFHSANGTRGARQPKAGRLSRWFNAFMMNRIRRTGGRAMGFDALVLTTVGAKSGQPRTNPVGYFTDGDGWLIVASAAGAPKNPAWYYNIAAHPDRVRIELRGQHLDVVATQLHGEARARAWAKITTEAPQFAKYEEKTDREIPVIRLARR